MKMFEATNAQDQLDLLRLIIDNTWTAIKQQADTEARKNANKKIPKPRAARIPAPKVPAKAPVVKPLPKPIPPTQKPANQQMLNTAKPLINQLTPTEREELAKATATQIGITAQ
jgi:hypothetical protein